MSIGERISNLRKRKNLSQVQLAKLMGVSRQAVSKWENDQTAPDTMKLIQLADVLDTDAEYLATGNHSKIKSPPTVMTVVKKVDNVVEKVVEKPVVVEKVVEVEKIVEVEKQITVEKPVFIEKQVLVETEVEKPVYKKIYRTKYVRNPIEFFLVGLLGAVIGLLIGIMI